MREYEKNPCKIAYQNARDHLNLLAWKYEKLTEERIIEELKSKAGTTKLNPGLDVRDWLEEMVDEGLVRVREDVAPDGKIVRVYIL